MDALTLILVGVVGITLIAGAVLLVRFGLSATQGAGGSDIKVGWKNMPADLTLP